MWRLVVRFFGVFLGILKRFEFKKSGDIINYRVSRIKGCSG